MKYGAVLPQTEIGADPSAIREYAQAVEDLGYSYILAYDHVLGADVSVRPNWTGPYTSDTMFHEPFVLFGYLAAVTRTIELVTGVIILPQRQTALVAKQAAEVDVLSNGRLRLGIGIGWNNVEYEALSQNFHDRGQRSEEQVEVLRELWTKPVVTYDGRWHKISAAGLNPLPVQRPIPIDFGGGWSDRVLRRIARLGDGWMPQTSMDDQGRALVEKFRTFVTEAGRDPSEVRIDARVSLDQGLKSALENSAKWDDLYADVVGVNTMRMGFTSVDQHIAALQEFRSEVM